MDRAPKGELNGTLSNKLTARESALMEQAGQRVASLSRRLADADKEVGRLTAANEALHELLDETRRSRDILSAQVNSLQLERDREYDERAELRRLLASLHLQVQELLPALTATTRSQQPPWTGDAPVHAVSPPVPQLADGPSAPAPPITPKRAPSVPARRQRKPSLSSRLVAVARDFGLAPPALGPGRR
jgi:hypothetical protein